MGKKRAATASSNGANKEAELENEREKERVKFIETLGGWGMPLEELGLLLVPAMSAEALELRYGGVIELGKAKAKAGLVQMIWANAPKSTTLQIYLSKVALGWSEKGVRVGLPEQDLDNPQAPPALLPPAAEIEGKMLNLVARPSPRSSASRNKG